MKKFIIGLMFLVSCSVFADTVTLYANNMIVHVFENAKVLACSSQFINFDCKGKSYLFSGTYLIETK